MAATSSYCLKLHFPFKPERKPPQTSLFFPSSVPSQSKIVAQSISSSSTAHSVDVVSDEEVEKIKRLQNGSDVRGVAVEGEKGRSVDLTPPAVEAIAESFGEWLKEKVKNDENAGGKKGIVKVSLGRDPRISGAMLSAAVFAGLSRGGCVVYNMGLATTPACFMSTILPSFDYDGAIMECFTYIQEFKILRKQKHTE